MNTSAASQIAPRFAIALATLFSVSAGTASAPQPGALSQEALEQCASAEVAECQFQLGQHLEQGEPPVDLIRVRDLYEAAYSNGHEPAGDHLLRLLGDSASPSATDWRRPDLSPAPGSAAGSLNTHEPQVVVRDAVLDISGSKITSKGRASSPVYPRVALDQLRFGTTTLHYTVHRDGTVSDVAVASTSGHDDLDQSAIQAAQEWVIKGIEWSPSATQKDVVRLKNRVDFTLNGHSRRFRFFSFYLGQKRAEFQHLVADARCDTEQNKIAVNCYGTLRTGSGKHRVVAAFGSDLLIGAVMKFADETACTAAREELESLNGRGDRRAPQPLQQSRRNTPGLSISYWSRPDRPDSLMIGCSGAKGLFFASVGPAVSLATSTYVDATLLDR